MYNTWTQKADFGGIVRYGAVSFSIGNKTYVGTGFRHYSGSDHYYKDFWEYNPDANAWTQKADFGGTRRDGAVGFSIGNKGYIGTGHDGIYGIYLKDFWEYNPNNNTWTPKADFGGTARYGAVGFSIGNKGYIGTGYDNESHRKDFWEYNPATNTWTQKADFGGTGRRGAVGFSIGNKGYIGTGLSVSNLLGHEQKDFWEYDPGTNTWTQKADFRGAARWDAAGFSIENKGYIGTGQYYDNGIHYYCKDFWEYNSDINIWTQRADFGGIARYDAVGFSIGNKGYIGTGVDNALSAHKDFWEYDAGPSTSPNTWVRKADFGGIGRYGAVGFSIGNRGYIGTGRRGSYDYRDFWMYNPDADVWTQKADFGGEARHCAAGFSIGDKGYIGTGFREYGANYYWLKDFWQYNSDTNAWTQRADFGGAGRLKAVGFSIGNRGYIGTGEGGYYEDFWEYNPDADAWTRKADFGGRKRSGAVGFSIGNKGYIGTGYGGSYYLKDFWEYNPSDNTWTQKADFGGDARDSAVGFSLRNKGYIGVGCAGGRDFWEYNPDTNVWTQRANYGGSVGYNAVGFSIGNKGYIGTGYPGGGSSASNEFWEYTPTPITSPAAAVLDTTAITHISALLHGTIAGDGGDNCYGKFAYTEDSGLGINDWTKTPLVGGSYTSGISFERSIGALTPVRKYFVKAAAKNTSGLEWSSNIKEFITVPDPPTNLNLVVTSRSGIDLSWVQGTYANSIEIRRKEGSYPNTISDGVLVYSGTGTSYSDNSLTEGTTYYYRAWSRATAYGKDLVSTSYAQNHAKTMSVPSINTRAASEVTETTARLNAVVTDDGGDTCQVAFEWGPIGQGESPVTGYSGSYHTGDTPYHDLSGLEPRTEYWFRARIKNSAGESVGETLYFTTVHSDTYPKLPSVETEAATQITPTTATLNAKVTNDGGDVCQIKFEWGTTGSETQSTEYFGNYFTGATPHHALSGLQPGTEYWFRAKIKNGVGEAEGTTLYFTTSSATSRPSIETVDASGVTLSSATLNAQVIDDGGEACQVAFEWGTTGGETNSTSYSGSYRTGDTPHLDLTGLQSLTQYWFRAKIRNGLGETIGNTLYFTTEIPIFTPVIRTTDATEITETSAILNAEVIEDGHATCQVAFEWGTTAGDYTNATPYSGSYHTGDTPHLDITGLQPETEYWFRARIKNGLGEFDGGRLNFTTPPAETCPSIETLDATEVTQVWARLNAKVTNDGGEPCQVAFEWGITGGETNDTGYSGSYLTGNFPHHVLSGLIPNTTYWFRAKIRNSSGESKGEIIRFTTSCTASRPSIETVAASGVWMYGATLNAKVTNDGGEDCYVGFEWGDTSAGWVEKREYSVPYHTNDTPYYVVKGLAPNTRYWFKAKIRNSAGESEGATLYFTTGGNTHPPYPEIRTSSATEIAQTTARLNAYVTADGGEACQVAFEWGIAGSLTNDTGYSGSYHIGDTPSCHITGLQPGTEYWFRAKIKNSATEYVGNTLSFIANGQAHRHFPAIETKDASPIASYQATLNAKVTNDGGEACQVRFEWGLPGGWNGWTLYSGSYHTGDVVQHRITGLQPNTRYWFKALIKNGVGESIGNTLYFTTTSSVTPSPPAIETKDAIYRTPNTARLTALVTDCGEEACQVQFEWGIRGGWTAYSGYIGSYYTNDTPYHDITDLSPNTEYWFWAKIKNSAGESTGDIVYFKTPSTYATPTVQTNDATLVKETTATVGATVLDDKRQLCKVAIEYGITANYGLGTSWKQEKRTGDSITENLIGLNPGTLYNFRAIIRGVGTNNGYGDNKTFLTKPKAPTGLTASVVSQHQITLSWTKGVGAARTLIRRKVGSYPVSRTDGKQVYLGTDSTYTDTAEPNTTYYYTAWSEVTNSGLQQYSDSYSQVSATATVANVPPTISTEPATETIKTTARLNGIISNTGYPKTVTYWFEYGTTEALGNFTQEVVGNGYPEQVSIPLSGLTLGQTYYFRFCARNEAGTVYGDIRHFTQVRTPNVYVKDRVDDLLFNKIDYPDNGVAGQVLVKTSDIRGVQWANIGTDGGGGGGSETVEFVFPFKIVFPSGIPGEDFGNYHYEIEVATDMQFTSGIVLDTFSLNNQTGWYYFAGETFVPIPPEGVNPIYNGYRGLYKTSNINYRGSLYYRVRAYDTLSGVEAFGPWWGDVVDPVVKRST